MHNKRRKNHSKHLLRLFWHFLWYFTTILSRMSGNSLPRSYPLLSLFSRQNRGIQNINSNPVKMKVDSAQIVPLRGSPIFYLDKEHLSNNANVTLISQNGEKLKVNHLQLAIFNRLLLNENFEDEPAVITTNLGKFNS